MRARDIMTSPVITVRPDTPLPDAAAVFAEHGFAVLPVVDGDRLAGMVTEADLAPYGAARSMVQTVGEVMSAPAVTMEPSADIIDLSMALLNARRRSLPIVAGSRLVGIVTRRDLARALGRDDASIARDVRNRLASYAGSTRWTIDVRGGVVTIGERFDDQIERHIATAIAEAVPGVVRAYAITVQPAGIRGGREVLAARLGVG